MSRSAARSGGRAFAAPPGLRPSSIVRSGWFPGRVPSQAGSRHAQAAGPSPAPPGMRPSTIVRSSSSPRRVHRQVRFAARSGGRAFASPASSAAKVASRTFGHLGERVGEGSGRGSSRSAARSGGRAFASPVRPAAKARRAFQFVSLASASASRFAVRSGAGPSPEPPGLRRSIGVRTGRFPWRARRRRFGSGIRAASRPARVRQAFRQLRQACGQALAIVRFAVLAQRVGDGLGRGVEQLRGTLGR